MDQVPIDLSHRVISLGEFSRNQASCEKSLKAWVNVDHPPFFYGKNSEGVEPYVSSPIYA
jgi:hypothetical protein